MTPTVKARQLPNYQYDRPTHFISSQKNNRLLWCNSIFEVDRALTLEFADEVPRYSTQSGSIVYPGTRGRPARYTPDFFIQCRDGFRFEEVKPEKYTKNEDFRRKHHLHSMYIHQYTGVRLDLVTETDFRIGDTIRNYRLLYRYRRVAVGDWSRQKLIANLGKSPLFGEMREFMSSRSLSPVIAFALLCKRRYRFDVTQKLTAQTRLEFWR